MLVREAMTTDVLTVDPRDSTQYAAARMREHDVGILPVTEEGSAVGVVTDRDIALRCCAEGKDPHSTAVREIMTTEVIDCRETRELVEATQLMEDKKVRRLLVTDDEGILTGVLSVDDLASRMHDSSVFSRVLHEVALGVGQSSAQRA